MKHLTRWIVLGGLLTAPSLFRAEEHCAGGHYEEEWEMEEMDKEIESLVLKYIHEVEPRAVPVMKLLGKHDPYEYGEMLFDLAEAIEEIKELWEEEPEFARLYKRILDSEIRMEYLGDAIQHATSNAKREKLTAELRELLPRAFDDRMKESEMELEMLEQEVQEVKADWERRKANKERIIERRFKELTREDGDLEW